MKNMFVISGQQKRREARVSVARRGGLIKSETRFVCLATSGSGIVTFTLKVVQPVRLIVVLRGEDAGIQENQNYDQPVEDLGLDGLSAGSSHPSVHSANSILRRAV